MKFLFDPVSARVARAKAPKCVAMNRAGDRCGANASKGHDRCACHGGPSKRFDAGRRAFMAWRRLVVLLTVDERSDPLLLALPVAGRVVLGEAIVAARVQRDPSIAWEAREYVRRKHVSRVRWAVAHGRLSADELPPIDQVIT